MNNSPLRTMVALVLVVIFTGVTGAAPVHAQGGGTCTTDAAGNRTCENSTTITTSGYNEVGVNAYSPSGIATVINTNTGSVTTTGQYGFGLATSGELGTAAINNGAVTTTGFRGSGLVISSDHGTVTVTNGPTGTVNTSGERGLGLQVSAQDGAAIVVNEGRVTTTGPQSTGVSISASGGSITIINTGTVVTTGPESDGLRGYTHGEPVTIINRGTVTVTGTDSVGIVTLFSSNDTIINSGDITSSAGQAIDTDTGDDTVIIEGGRIEGPIDGGDDHDRLAFSAVLDAASYEGLHAELEAQLAGADPAGGTITFRGEAYTYANFEQLLNWLMLAMHHDGRVNYLDLAATATAYCAGGGAQLYRIHADGVGEWAYNVTDGAVQAALAEAFATGQHVLIADRLGVQLWALADLSAEGVQQLQLMGPDYRYIFPANTCGFTD